MNSDEYGGNGNSAGDLRRTLDSRKDVRYILSLYITGTTPRSTRAIVNVRKICEDYLKDRYELKVIDISQDPSQARAEQIIAAPTLIKEMPLPLRRFIGDMSKTRNIIVGLDLDET